MRPISALDVAAVIAAGAQGETRVPLLAEQPHGKPARRGSDARGLPRRSPRVRWSWSTRPTSSSPAGRSLASELAQHPNLVLLRTLSKAYALAGARCGALLASEAIVALLARIIPPYALPASTVEAVMQLTAGPQRAQAAARIATLLEERERMRTRLAALPGVRRVLPSDANFLLVEFAEPQSALAVASDAGLLVRDLTQQPAASALPAAHGRDA